MITVRELELLNQFRFCIKCDLLTYMKWGLAVDILAVDVDFIVMEQRDHIVNVCVGDGMEQNVTAYLFHLSNHFIDVKIITII